MSKIVYFSSSLYSDPDIVSYLSSIKGREIPQFDGFWENNKAPTFIHINELDDFSKKNNFYSSNIIAVAKQFTRENFNDGLKLGVGCFLTIADLTSSVTNSNRLIKSIKALVKGLSTYRFVFLNNQIYEPEAVWALVDYLGELVGISENDLFYTAFYEILVNALEHGNLGITSAQKEELLQQGTYYAYLEENIKANPEVVVVSCRIKKRLKIVVEDNGKGFDYKNLLPPDKSRLTGRGVKIAQSFFDSVKYKKNGSKVVLKKKFSTAQD